MLYDFIVLHHKFCVLPSSAAGSGRTRIPRASVAQVQSLPKTKKIGFSPIFLFPEKERFAAGGQLKPTIHTSYAKAHSCSLGFCQFCVLPSSATGSGCTRIPRASVARVQSLPKTKKIGFLPIFLFPEKERNVLLRNPPCLPTKLFEFWYRATHHLPTKQSAGLF